MPKLPKNMIKRPGRKGYWFRQMAAGKAVVRFLGTDYDQARTQLRSLKDDVPPSSLTVAEAARRWLSVYVPVQRRADDHALANQRVDDYLIPILGHYLLHRLRGDHVRVYRQELGKRTLSVQSVKHILSDLRCLLNWAEDTGLMDRSPFPRRVMPKIQERPPDRIKEDDLAKIVSVPDPYGFICRFLLETGVRWGEAIRAQTSDIQAGVLVVHQTKSGKVRRVPLSSSIQGELRNRVGRIVPLKHACHLAKIVCRLSGVEKFHVHQLRHTFACRWLERGGSLAALQELLGHSSIVTTRRYGRLAEAHVVDEMRRLEGGRK